MLSTRIVLDSEYTIRTVSRASPCAQGTSVRVSGLDTKKIVSHLMVKDTRALK